MRLILGMMFTALIVVPAKASDGLERVKSQYDVPTTTDRLIDISEMNGLTVFNRIDHGRGAKNVGIDIAPSELLIVGNPKAGSLLMKCSSVSGIDLPLKFLVSEVDGKVWIYHNKLEYIKSRHQIEGCDKVITAISSTLMNIANKAAI
ncbi:hypothetical protein TUM4438_10870 [Shewanella sairae]|uniref:DUF302 domain-containing protein n=1 Tax=Shewanella sairae TaxID=190310 RepID=A0ABQ4P688_9GAMM|nr:DUF302 domain-containing protein [Shewanella sairae]MCL1130520.1 DUF302 domain-containing protein [Shewanella sairae]GIU42991.1 hypothetical protein TUM4438_10870 [Shewanella sairae]